VQSETAAAFSLLSAQAVRARAQRMLALGLDDKLPHFHVDPTRLDGVVDLDVVLRDPGHPTQLLPIYDSGDHLHPNNAGCVAEANAIPLALFEGH